MSPTWTKLFADGSQVQRRRRFITLSRHGRPFLWLPQKRKAALRALELYPAQRKTAQAAVAGVRLLLSVGLKTLLHGAFYPLSTNTPFAQFLINLAGTSDLPDFAVLSGNPNALGTRQVFLVFDQTNTEPLFVVKVGLTPSATALIDQEGSFLSNYGSANRSIPKHLTIVKDENFSALALPYLEGKCPSADKSSEVAAVLRQWVIEGNKIPLREIPPWQSIAPLVTGALTAVTNKVPNLTVQPVLMHGDFAPWNIRVNSNGIWQVLDWERGQAPGVPGWDWFHFSLQYALLVKKYPADCILKNLTELISSSTFQDYAQQTNIKGAEWLILEGYLYHCLEVLKPEHGSEKICELLAAVKNRNRPKPLAQI